MEKIKVREKDIRKVVFTTEDSWTEYTKYTKDDTLYHVRYHYSEKFLGHNTNYCRRCGETFPDQNTSCPYCNGEGDDVLNYKDIGTMIYKSLDDEMKVIIEKWNGEKLEV